jgi:elongation factor Ts
MEISASMVKELREKTGAGIMDCKEALKEASGSFEGAIDFLRKKGVSKAYRKAGRISAEGMITSYVHPGGKIGVLVEINCETDFVARTSELQQCAQNIAMQIAAFAPQYIRREDIPNEVIEREREIYRAQVRESGKPEKVIKKIIDGKMEKFYSEICLLDQSYIREEKISVKDLLTRTIAKVSENISIRRFARFQLGERLEERSEAISDTLELR